MRRDEVLRAVDLTFGTTSRPAMFIRGTCSCEECLEHNDTMAHWDPLELPLEELNNTFWDPLCAASSAALHYLMPGLVRLVLDHANDFLNQFLLHIDKQELMESLTPSQATALKRVLDTLVREEPVAVHINAEESHLASVSKQLAGKAGLD